MNPRQRSPNGRESSQSAAKMQDLEDMTTFIEFSQLFARSNVAEKLGLGQLTKPADLNTVVQLDDCLNTLETNHALALLSESARADVEDISSQQRLLFQLR